MSNLSNRVTKQWLIQQTETNPNLVSVTTKILGITIKEFHSRVERGQICFEQLPLKFIK